MPRMIAVKLNPAISVLAIVAMAFVGLGVARLVERGGDCVLNDQEQVSPLKVVKWAVAAVRGDGSTRCDILTFEPRGGSVVGVALPMLRHEENVPDYTILQYVFVVMRDGSSRVYRQRISTHFPDGKLQVGPIEKVLVREPSGAGKIGFEHIMERVGPLLTLADKRGWGSLFVGSDGYTLDSKSHEKLPEGRHCLKSATDTPSVDVGFWLASRSQFELAVSASWCGDKYTDAEAFRIDDAQEIAFRVAQFRPPEPRILLP